MSTLELRAVHGMSLVGNMVRNSTDKTVKVGIVEGTGEHPKADGGQTIAEIAAINELGGDRIPSRPFMRTTLRENAYYRKELAAALRASLLIAMRGTGDPDAPLKRIGARAAADMRNMIDTNDFRANAPSTIRAKSTNKTRDNKQKPLVDTGILRQSIQFALED